MIKYNGKHLGVSRAVKLANRMFSNNNFYSKISKGQQFDMSDISNKELANLLKISFHRYDIEVKLWKPWWYFSRAIAMFDKRKPNTIFLNARKLQRSDESILGSIAHEFVHLVDNKAIGSFGHGNNYRRGKENTAPYKIGTIASEFYE